MRTHVRRAALFLAIGGLSAAVDVSVLTLSQEAANLPLPVGTVLGLSVAFLVNFTLNRRLFAGFDGAASRQLSRYLVAVAVNYALTIALVSSLALVVHYLLAKLAALAVCAALNYWMYNTWVFAVAEER